MLLSGVTKLFQEANLYNETLDSERIKKIIQDIDIASALQKLERAVSGRKLLIKSKNLENTELEKEIQQRFSNVKFNRILNHLITARYFGYSCFEIVYNEDFSISTLIPIIFDYVYYDNQNKLWKVKIGTNEIPLTREKFLLCIHKWNPAQPTGKSIFECCHQAFIDKTMFQRQLRELSEKYGDIIVIYPYDINMEEKEKEELRKSVENLKGAKTIGAPVDFDEEFDLKKVVDFIKLSDLDPKIYTELENREKEKLIQNILGSTLTMDNGGGTGSYSLGEVHKEGFDEVVEEICKFVTDSLYQLIELDSRFYGYNPKEFEFSLEKIYTEKDKLIQDKSKEELRTIKLDNLQKLSSIGYKLTKSYLAELLGFDEDLLVEDEKSLKFTGMAREFAHSNDINDRLFNTIESQKKFEEYLKKKIDKFTENIENQIIKQLDNIDKGKELVLNLDYSSLEDDLILSQISSYVSAKSILSGLSIETFDPFNMPFQEAIKSFVDKTPILYETIEEITEEVRANSFWLKKSTDLEITSKLFENMKKSLENGGTLKQWIKDSKETIDKLGLGKQGYYLENVYRTNMFSQYSIGNYKQLKEDEDLFPYWQYHAIEDNRTTSICRTLNGKIYKSTDPFWNIYYPPNHYQCRSTVICLSKSDMKEQGYKVSKFDETMTGEELGSFKGNPAQVYWQDMEKRANEKQGVFVWE